MPVETGLYEILGLQGNANHSVSDKTFFLSLNIYNFLSNDIDFNYFW